MPTRSAHRWWMHWNGKMPVAVLFYHRVSDRQTNPWTITQSQFERQLDWFVENFDIVTLPECQRRITASNTRPTLAITFDDGYSENCEWAIPTLIARQIPFTYFVAWGNIVEQKPFQHDIEANTPAPLNTVEEIRSLVEAGVEIGGHTMWHRDLGKITDRTELEEEVFRPMQDMEQTLGCPIRYFAFPFGQIPNLNADVFRMAKERGLLGVCSTIGQFNLPGDDPFHLKRLHGDPCLARMKNWLTYDHRLFTKSQYTYEIDG